MKILDKDIQNLYNQVLQFQDNKILLSKTCEIIRCKYSDDDPLYLEAACRIFKLLDANNLYKIQGTRKYETEVIVDYVPIELRGTARIYVLDELRK